LLFLFTFMFIGLWCLRPLFSQEMDYEQFLKYRTAKRREMTAGGWHPRETPWWYDALSQKVQGWDTVLTEHYAVRTNIGLKGAYLIASKAERMAKVYTAVFEDKFGLPPVAEYLLPATIQVFGSKKSWDKYRKATARTPSGSDGYLSRVFEEVVCCAELKNLEGNLFHECFHHWLHCYFDFHFVAKDPPNWLNEGLAMYFEVILGGKSGWLSSLKKKIKKGEIKSLKKIISAHKKFEYDESWGIAHFLMYSQNRKRLPLIGDYIKRLMRGENHIKAFEEVFGSDYSSLEKEWKRYILALRK